MKDDYDPGSFWLCVMFLGMVMFITTWEVLS